MCKCPTCGSEIADATPLDVLVKEEPFGFHFSNMVRELLRVYPRGVSMERMIDVLYNGADVPLTAANIVSVTAGRLRKRLRPYGWRLAHSKPGPGGEGRFRLEKSA